MKTKMDAGEAQVLLASIREECRAQSELHKRASKIYARRSMRLTVVNALASIMILFVAANEGAQVFISESVQRIAAAAGSAAHDAYDVDLGDLAVGVLSAVAVFTCTLQFLLKYEERNLIHKYVSADYQNIAREIGRLLVRQAIADEELREIVRQVGDCSRHAPPVSSKLLKWSRPLHHVWRGLTAEQLAHAPGDAARRGQAGSPPLGLIGRSADADAERHLWSHNSRGVPSMWRDGALRGLD